VARAALAEALEPEILQFAPIEPRHLGDWMVRIPAGEAPLALIRPRNTSDIAKAMRVCNAHRIPVVPQGGLTGLTGGATPVAGCVVLSLERLATIEALDPDGSTISVGAGVSLQAVQEAADSAGLMFGLDIGARGSCRVGGNAATNAGGNRVLRFGMMRELVLGLEAVLADGTVVSSMNTMLKNNAGYDLKHLFIGSEGTLGVITRLVLRLHPKPRSVATAMVSVADYPAALRLLRIARERLGPTLSAFEAMWPDFYNFALMQRGSVPMPADGSIHVLVEAMGTDETRDAEHFESAIAASLDDGCADDAVIAQSGRERSAIWSIRDASGELARAFSPHVDYDVSLPVGRIGEFADECRRRLISSWADGDVVCFGHIADGNLHVSAQIREGIRSKDDTDRIVYGCVAQWQGSVSAEHGIGLLKKAYLGYSRGPEELALMRTLKAALDPHGILNPGKVF
jgi:FAD/FMN-containing dehydrogenase